MKNKEQTYVLIPPNQYSGKQAIVNSDRILINAKNDCALIFANKAIGLSSAGTLNFDSDSSCIINSPKIYLGLTPTNTLPTEPLLLGNQTGEWLKRLVDALIPLAKALAEKGLYVGSNEVVDLSVNYPSQNLQQELGNLNRIIEKLKSKTSYTV